MFGILVISCIVFHSQHLVPGELPKPELDWDYNLGDIILGMPVISDDCTSDGARLRDRLPVIVTHGLCHLIGYRHESSKQCDRVCSFDIIFCTIHHRILVGKGRQVSCDMTPFPFLYHALKPGFMSLQMYRKELLMLTSFNQAFGTKLRPLTEPKTT